MRKGRPCSCGCDNCHGGCMTKATIRTCKDGVVGDISYLDFKDSFTNTLASGWTDYKFKIASDEGIADSGTGFYTIDTVVGEAIREPSLCATYDGRLTIKSAGEGFVSFGINGGPNILVNNSGAYLTLPNSSSVLIDNLYESGDRYEFILENFWKPPGKTEQSLEVFRTRYNISTGPCPFGGSIVASGINSSGCKFYTCKIYSKTFFEADATGVYSINSPLTYTTEVSGAGWSMDDLCYYGFESAPDPMIPGGVMSSGGKCIGNCNYILPAHNVFYTRGTSAVKCIFDTSSPIYLLFEAYNSNYLRQDNPASIDWRCYLDVPNDSGSSIVFRVKTKSYSIDLMGNNVWSHTPVKGLQHTPTYDADPLESGDQEATHFVGYPCFTENCYGPPFPVIDNSLLYGFSNYDKENFEFVKATGVIGGSSGCKQIGLSYSFPASTFQNDVFYAHTLDACTIPREDRLSVVRLELPFGGPYLYNLSYDPVWSVNRPAFNLNWDSTNGWWHSRFRHMQAFGSIPSGGPWTGLDLGIFYKSGDCGVYDLYFSYNCGEQPLTTVLKSGEIVWSGPMRVEGADSLSTSDNILFRYANRYVGFDNNDYTLVNVINYDDVFSPGVPSIYTCNTLTGLFTTLVGARVFAPSGIPESGVLDCNSFDCPYVKASGSYDYELLDQLGYSINVGSDFEQNELPYTFIDMFGFVIRRGGSGENALISNFYHTSFFTGGCPIPLRRTHYYELGAGNSVSSIASHTIDYAIMKGQLYSCIDTSGSMPDLTLNGWSYFAGTLPLWRGVSKGVLRAYHSPYSPIATNNPTFNGLATDDIQPLTDNFPIYENNSQITTFILTIFLDTENQKLRAYATPYSIYDDLPYQESASDWFARPDYPIIKSDLDLFNDCYFGTVEVLNTNPLRLYIKYPFMAWGIPYNDPLETDCQAARLYGYTFETIIEEPTIEVL